MIELFGNSIWNNNTPNTDKKVIIADEKELKKIEQSINNAGFNYCAYIRKGNAYIAVNKNDVENIHKLNINIKAVSNSNNKPYKPNKIIGNTPFKNINNKYYQKYSADIAYAVAYRLDELNIPFSGKLYDVYNSVTITIDKAYVEQIQSIAKEITEQRSLIANSNGKITNAIKDAVKKLNYSEEQLKSINKAENLLLDRIDDENLLSAFDAMFEGTNKYSADDIAKLSDEFVKIFENLHGLECVFASRNDFNGLKKEFDKNILFEKYTQDKGFSSEQEKVIKNMIDKNMDSVLDILDFTFSVSEMEDMYLAYQQGDYDRLINIVASVKDTSRIEIEGEIESGTYTPVLPNYDTLDRDLFFNNPDSESVTHIYYNSDANSGGQFVISEINYYEIENALKKFSDKSDDVETFFDYLDSISEQKCIDIGDDLFLETYQKFYSNEHIAEGITDEVKKQLTNIATVNYTVPDKTDYYKSYFEIQSEHPDAIILFRVGDFYEVLGDNAQEAAEALNLTLMSRTINGEKIPMVGFPSSYLEDNENLLVEIGYKILTVEQEDIAERASLRNKAQEVAKQNNLPFSDKFSMGFEDDFDTAVYDGSMSADDYEKLQQADIEPKADRPTVAYFPAKAQDENEVTQNIETEQPTLFDFDNGDTLFSDAAHTTVEKGKNYVMEDRETVTGAKTKFKNNITAIRILKTLESENRKATVAEQRQLSLYTGWGGLANAFEPDNDKWKNEYLELKNLLTDDEYTAARSSVLDAFYTDSTIIDSIYKVIQNAGLESGNILEPAMGIGNFFGRLPADLRGKVNLYGVEKDSLSGRIAQKLYPQANITIDGFENTHFNDNSFDVAIGNIPFGDFGVNDKKYNSQNLKIHDYFFLKSLDKVRDGGIVAFVTSKGTLDKKDSSFRKTLAERADLVGAVRLPNNAFKSAGTEVTVDIIFLQKREKKLEIEPSWVHTGQLETGLPVNNYFVKHPEMVLGEIVEGNKMYGRTDDTMCVPFDDGRTLSDLLAIAVNNINFTYTPHKDKLIPLAEKSDEIILPQGIRAESYFKSNNDIYFYGSNGEGDLFTIPGSELLDKKYTAKNINRISDFIELRDTLRELLDVQQYENNDDKVAQLQSKLNEPKVYKIKLDEFGIPVFDKNHKPVSELDVPATQVVQQKANAIRREFKNWLFKDADRRKDIIDTYNRTFNCIKPREYDGSHLTFPGMNSNIELHEHQKNAIAHAIFGGNTLFAHSVGAGKTFEMIATAMECKRLGMCHKSLFAVPNHLTEQVGDDFLKLYPNANILVATKEDFKADNRKKLMSKIATGNYDAVIIGHTQLKMLPLSPERQQAIYQEQIDNIIKGIAELKAQDGSNFKIKDMERTKKNLEKQLAKLQSAKKDNSIYFEELGIDKLFVDEAHEFKNLFCTTKLQNVSGISSRASQRATELFAKCRYLDEKTGGRGVVFATGTPISNSVTELHTMMRYLNYDFLANHNNMQNFDNWVSTFGVQKKEYELAPAGNKFKERTRIAEYSNLPELISMFKLIADVRTSDTLNLNVPDCEMHILDVEPTELQKELVDELSDRADNVNVGKVDPSEDNMLKITGDGRKLGLDPRLIDPEFEDNPGTKLNVCVNKVFEIYEKTSDKKLTQIVFCDLGVPGKNVSADTDGKDDDTKSVSEIDSLEETGKFCVYDDIKSKLIAKGVPAEEIAFIHDAKNEKQKSELFAKVRSGEVRVLLGSTGKMGTGTNVQDRIIALHDLDVPWRPSDLEQRRGRMVRQGNINKKVHLYRYVTKGTFDAYSYQLLEKKQKFISQIMTSKAPARKCSDVDQASLSYSEIKALCTGDERIREKLTLENRVKELTAYKSEYDNTRYELEDKVNVYPEQRKKLLCKIGNIQKDIDKLSTLPKDDEGLLIPTYNFGDTSYSNSEEDKKSAAKALGSFVELSRQQRNETITVGDICGFSIEIINKGLVLDDITATLGDGKYVTSFGSLNSHNLFKLENLFTKFNEFLSNAKKELNQLDYDYKSATEMLAKPFEFEQELTEKTNRLAELTTALNIDLAQRQNVSSERKTCYFSKNSILHRTKNKIAPEQNKPEIKRSAPEL